MKLFFPRYGRGIHIICDSVLGKVDIADVSVGIPHRVEGVRAEFHAGLWRGLENS